MTVMNNSYPSLSFANASITTAGAVTVHTLPSDGGELAELRDDRVLLYALIDSGVDSWEGYDEAVKLYLERKEEG